MNRIACLLALSLALPLAGCTGTGAVQDPFLTAATGAAGNAGTAAAPPLSTEISPQLSLVALPPAAGRIVSVQQVTRKDGLDQTVVYANGTAMAGDNRLTVEIDGGDAARRLRPPTRGELRRDMAEVLPGIAMRIDDVIGDNAQGVFGYALGAAAGFGRCIYGWQVVKTGALVSSAHAASIRLRFCDPVASDAQLVSLMQGLRLMPVSDEGLAMLRMTRPLVTLAPAPVQPATFEVPVRESPAPRRSRPRHVAASAPAEPMADVASVAVPMPDEVLSAAKPVKAAVVAPPAGKAQTATAPQIRDAVTIPLPE